MVRPLLAQRLPRYYSILSSRHRSARVVPVDTPTKIFITFDRHWWRSALCHDVVTPTAIKKSFYLDLDAPLIDSHPLRIKACNCERPTAFGNPMPVLSEAGCHQCVSFGIHRHKFRIIMRWSATYPLYDDRYRGESDQPDAHAKCNFSKPAHALNLTSVGGCTWRRAYRPQHRDAALAGMTVAATDPSVG